MSRRVITPEAILSYPHLFEPNAMDDGAEPKYSACFVFPADADLKELKAAALEAAQEKWGSKAAKMIRDGKLRMPFRTDGEEKGYPEGSTFINCRSNRRPGIVSTVPDPKNGGKPSVITDDEEVYAGCIVRASVTAFAYDVNGNRGVSFALGNVQKIRDGERLDGRVSAEDEFKADDTIASLDDLTDEAGESGDDLSDLL